MTIMIELGPLWCPWSRAGQDQAAQATNPQQTHPTMIFELHYTKHLYRFFLPSAGRICLIFRESTSCFRTQILKKGDL